MHNNNSHASVRWDVQLCRWVILVHCLRNYLHSTADYLHQLHHHRRFYESALMQRRTISMTSRLPYSTSSAKTNYLSAYAHTVSAYASLVLWMNSMSTDDRQCIVDWHTHYLLRAEHRIRTIFSSVSIFIFTFFIVIIDAICWCLHFDSTLPQNSNEFQFQW